MILLVAAVIAGLVTALSPCILPVLPVLAAGGVVGGSRWRPAAIVCGMMATFAIVVLAGSELLSLLGLPQSVLRDIGIGMLFALAAGLIVPALGDQLERPFSRIGLRRTSGSSSGLLLGASLGLVFVPCAGPVLAAVTVVGATHRVGLESVLVTLFYGLGAGVPLFALVTLTRRASLSGKALRGHALIVRRCAGALIAASAVLIVTGALQPLQRDLPSYATAVDARIDGNASVSAGLRNLTGEHVLKSTGVFARNLPGGQNRLLSDYGPAPRLLHITSWMNTDGKSPTIASLRGKVVLVDFWTYSCINCQREIPHLEAWYRTYAPYGLVVVGVHTPEFSFERQPSNVRSAVQSLGITYPVGIDDSYATWLGFGVTAWPSLYLVDQTGQLRYVQIGEGNYVDTENVIRDLLSDKGQWLPPRTSVENATPDAQITSETYLGYYGIESYIGPKLLLAKARTYHFAPSVPVGELSASGVWTFNGAEATAGKRASLRLHFEAHDVYLVAEGHGNLKVKVDGVTHTVALSGYPRLYTLFRSDHLARAVMQVDASPGLQLYDFTFG